MDRLKLKETQSKSQEQQTTRNYRIKTQNKQVLPIEMIRNIKDMFKVCFRMEMDEKDEKN